MKWNRSSNSDSTTVQYEGSLKWLPVTGLMVNIDFLNCDVNSGANSRVLWAEQ